MTLSLPAWLLMAALATPAMMPTVANAHPVPTQERFLRNQNIRPRATGRAGAYSNTWSGNRVQTYRQPPVSQARTRSHGYSTAKTRSHGNVLGTSGRNDRRR